MQRVSQVLVGVLSVLLCCSMACNKKNKEVTLGNVSASKNQKTLVVTEDMRDKTAYQGIKGNIPRLKAMLCGKFTAYLITVDSTDFTKKVYEPWLVNEGNDSVVIYTIPVGEVSRQGHWLYLYQCMTSLPDDPIYQSFVKLEEINRDSIIAIYYDLPNDFEYSINDILMDPKGSFREFNFEQLLVSEIGEKVWYERQALLKYYGWSNWMKTKDAPRPDYKDGYNRDYYIITPYNYIFGKEYSKKDTKKNTIKSVGTLLLKQEMLSQEYIGE